MSFRIELGEDYTVSIFSETQPEPAIFQPHNPEGRPWVSYTEASDWATQFVAELEVNTTSSAEEPAK